MSDDTMHQCPKCTWPLERVWSKKRERYYWFCSQPNKPDDTPTCGAIFSEDEEGNPILRHVEKSEPDPKVKCPECGAPMALIKGGKHGDFWSCSRREETGCRGTLDVVNPADPHQLPPMCPGNSSHGHMRLRAGKNGKFWGCRKYPDCKETLEINGKNKKTRRAA